MSVYHNRGIAKRLITNKQLTTPDILTWSKEMPERSRPVFTGDEIWRISVIVKLNASTNMSATSKSLKATQK